MKQLFIALLFALPAFGQSVGLPNNAPQLPSNLYTVQPAGSSGGINTQNGQGPVFNIKGYGAIGDTQHIRDGVTGGGTKTLTSATAAFCNGGSVPCSAGRTSDVGKKIVCGGVQFRTVATILSVTATVATTDTTDAGAVGSLQCIWYTQDDTTAIVAAVTAASTTSTVNRDPNLGTPTLLPLASTVVCPAGGYAISGRIYNVSAANAGIGPNFKGDGAAKCIFYVLPTTTDPNDGLGVIISTSGLNGITLSGFSIDGLNFASFAHSVFKLSTTQNFLVDDIRVTNIAGGGAGVRGTMEFGGSSQGIFRNSLIQGAPTGSNDFACSFNGLSSTILVQNVECSNHNQTLVVDNTGLRTVSGDNGITIESSLMDECGAAASGCDQISNGGIVHYISTTIFGNNPAISVDATSRAYLDNVSCGIFGSTTATANCMTIASGGFVTSSMSDLRGNDANSTTGVAVNGPAGATFVDIGGNKIRHSVSGVISDVTPAQYATLGFTGGIVPKSTQTHTPNTCYAVTGNLLATAQNLCTILLDQNYQVLNVTAQSGGTTPANSSCTGAPVITLSDGTRSATLTMTTGKTAWSSAVDAQTNVPGQVFASGTTLTVSIGANTCATPPANVSVNYNLQSVLNP